MLQTIFANFSINLLISICTSVFLLALAIWIFAHVDSLYNNKISQWIINEFKKRILADKTHVVIGVFILYFVYTNNQTFLTIVAGGLGTWLIAKCGTLKGNNNATTES